MGGRPRVRITATGERAEELRRWLLQSGADVVTDGEADAVAPGDATRAEVAAFVRALAGKRPHTFDDHGSGEAWPRGSY